MATPPGFDTLFLDAASRGDFPMIRSLVAAFENGEGPGKVSYAGLKRIDGQSALHAAAAAGKTSICRFLVEKLNFDINITDGDGFTPLVAAISHRHRPTTIYFVENGADVTKVGAMGTTPLHHAAEKGSVEIMKLLISKGADLNAIARDGMPLHFAAKGRNLDVLKFLLDLKADANFNAPLHTTPLQMAISSKSVECVELLLKAGGDPNYDCSQSQRTPLCVAVSDKNEEMVRCLLEAGADPNMTDLTGKTALEHAAMSGCREVVKLLFPFTSRIACYPDWSIDGVMRYEQSKEAMELRKSQEKKLIRLTKAKATEAFQRKDYLEVVHWYTQAIEATDYTDVNVLFNRSLCWSFLNEGIPALADAVKCAYLKQDCAKVHYREGKAWKFLKQYDSAAESFTRALACEPRNKEIENALRETLADMNKGSH